jgi:hypothetical protein
VTCTAEPLTIDAVAVRDDDRLAVDHVGNSATKAMPGPHGYPYHASAFAFSKIRLVGSGDR